MKPSNKIKSLIKKIYLKKFYSRDRSRDNDDNSLFKTIYKNLSFFSTTGWLILLTPTIILTSLLTQTAFLMIANIFLALGFVFNFCHRIYMQEVGFFEFFMTLIIVAALVILAFYLSPILTSTSLIGILCIVNLFSSSINSFFIIRNILLPPLASLTQSFFNCLGFSFVIHCFMIRPLELERDRSVIDRLLNKYYKYDSYSERYQEANLSPFNRLIEVLCRYINKYQETLLGHINHQDKIKKLEDALTKLIKEGNSESSMDFIHRKISFKNTKIHSLKAAKSSVETANKTQNFNKKNMNQFFAFLDDSDENNPQTIDLCLQLLNREIARQETKLKELSACEVTLCP